MLDLAISLALVYLMMAGLVSGLQEMVASALQLRGKQLQRGIASLLHEDRVTAPPPGSLLARIYAHPLIEALCDGKRRPSYIPANSFALALADVLTQDQGVRTPLFAGLPEAVANMPASPLKGSLQVLVQQAAARSESLQALLERHFNDVMDRVSGWYKRQAQWVTFGLALLLSVGLNVDSLSLARSLSAHPEQGSRVAEQAAQQLRLGAAALPTSAPRTTAVAASVAAPVAASDAVPPQGGNPAQPSIQLRQSYDGLTATGLPMGWSFDTQGFPVWPDGGALVLLGWLITALAATMGAPFWFDAVSRLVPLRGSGKPPVSSSGAGAGTTPAR